MVGERRAFDAIAGILCIVACAVLSARLVGQGSDVPRIGASDSSQTRRPDGMSAPSDRQASGTDDVLARTRRTDPLPAGTDLRDAGLDIEDREKVEGESDALRFDDFLVSPGFEDRLDRLARRSTRDVDTAELSRIYRRIAEQVITAQKGSVRLSGLACGLRICAGLVDGGNHRDYQDWATAFSSSAGLHGVDFRTAVISESHDPAALRFVFSTAQPNPAGDAERSGNDDGG